MSRRVLIALLVAAATPTTPAAAVTTHAPETRRSVPRTTLQAREPVRLRTVLRVRFDLRRLDAGARRATLSLRVRPRRTRLVAYRVRRNRVVGRAVVGRRSGGATRFRITVAGGRRESVVIADRPARRWRAGRIRLRVDGAPPLGGAPLTPPPTPAPAPPPPPGPGTPASVMAAGDIACDPADSDFNGGAGVGQ